MPRVAIKKQVYKINDLSVYIAGKMYERKLRQADLAELLNISQSAFSQRMKKGLFSYTSDWL